MQLKSFLVAALAYGLCVASAFAVAPTNAPGVATTVGDAATWRSAALSGAMQTAGAIDDPYRRAEALASIARTQAAVEDAGTTNRTINQALAAANNVNETEFRGWVLHDIVLAQIAVDDLHGARATAMLIEADRPHGAALAALADFDLRAGDLEAAQRAATKIRDSDARSEVLRQIVAVHASRGELRAARSELRAIKEPFYQALARGDIAVAEVKMGNIEGAHELAARAPRSARADVYSRVALARIMANDLRGGLETLQKITDVEDHALVQGRIAVVRAEAGEKDAARQLFADAIGSTGAAASSPHKAMTLAQLSRMQAAAGDSAGAKDTLRQARGEADRLPAGEERDEVLEYIARGQARAGDAAGALDSALQVQDRVARALLVRDAVTLQKDATSASASAASAGFDDPLIETAALFGVLGVQLMRKGEPMSPDTIDAARAAVRKIDEPQLKPAAFAALAAARTRTGDAEASAVIFQEALDAVAVLDRPDQRAAAYLRIVNALNDRLVFLGKPAQSVSESEN